jgi:hypothetical protein
MDATRTSSLRRSVVRKRSTGAQFWSRPSLMAVLGIVVVIAGYAIRYAVHLLWWNLVDPTPVLLWQVGLLFVNLAILAGLILCIVGATMLVIRAVPHAR